MQALGIERLMILGHRQADQTDHPGGYRHGPVGSHSIALHPKLRGWSSIPVSLQALVPAFLAGEENSPVTSTLSPTSIRSSTQRIRVAEARWRPLEVPAVHTRGHHSTRCRPRTPPGGNTSEALKRMSGRGRGSHAPWTPGHPYPFP